MLRDPMVFLDLETTGMAPAHERITEIGLVEVVDGELVGSWSQLVNPQKFIPPFIEALTGITNEMVEDAPSFAQLAPAMFERLEGKLLIAHNARFDYGFLKASSSASACAISRACCARSSSRANSFPNTAATIWTA
jgi:DNA polymerase-3 subunit epsilon